MMEVSYTDLLAGAPIKPLNIAMIHQLDALRAVRAHGTHNQALIESIASQLKRGELEWRDIDPVDVVQTEPNVFILADGYHRIAACELGKVKMIRARIVEGTTFEATMIAAGRVLEVDESVKTPTSSDDRIASVSALLKLNPELSDRQLARMLRLHHQQIARVRKRLGVDNPNEPYAVTPAKSKPEPVEDDEDDIFDFDETDHPAPEPEEPAEPADEFEAPEVAKVDTNENPGIGFGVDRYGEPYPSAQTRDSVELGARNYRNLLINHLDSAVRGLAELADTHESAHLNAKKISDLLRQAREYAKAAIPHAVYAFDPNTEPTTNTDKLCRECGYVTKLQYESMNKHKA